MPSVQPVEFIATGVTARASRTGRDRSGADTPALSARHGWDAIQGTVKDAVEFGLTRGETGGTARLNAEPGLDVVAVEIENGPLLVLHPEHFRDLLRSQQGRDPKRSATSGPIEIPSNLAWAADMARGSTSRGLLGRVVIKAIAVITGAGGHDPSRLAAAALAAAIDQRVTEGVYPVPQELPESFRPGADPKPLADGQLGGAGKPVLVLVHGTFVDTFATFGKLWRQHRAGVERLFQAYGVDGVFALDHATVGKSPIANASTLLKACAPRSRLHLLTHSRGGLVAEVLARACSARTADAGAATELALFDGPDDQRAELTELYRLAADRDVTVERLVRVACPARGTLLASERLDAALSIFRWALELSGLPIVPALVDFLAGVARERHRPDELAGLEAMMPSSALIRWLHACPTPVTGQLRVLAGDVEGDSLLSWVKTLASDAFFWTDNDLVVQTRSMYGGSARAISGSHPDAATTGATFALQRGGGITHFQYFHDRGCVDAILAAVLDERPAGFEAIGPLSAAGREASGRRGAGVAGGPSASARASGPDRPAVFVLPGILGSHLARDGHRIWFAPPIINGLSQLAWRGETDFRFTAEAAMDVYDGLIDYLRADHDVIPFPFDWRRPIGDEALRLARAIDAELSAREATGQPVRLLAHSMGGLVARTVEIVAPETWKRLMAHPAARLVMLGTPNGGSWAPMQILTGDDDFGNTIAALGALFDDAGARRTMAGMPGLLQMQAGLLDPALGLADAARWSELAADDRAWLERASVWHDGALSRSYYEWSAPPQAVLELAVELRRKLDAQLGWLPEGRLVTVLGAATWTPSSFRLGTDGLEYELRRNCGDGRVLDHAAVLPGVPAWRVDRGHADLVTATAHFAAYAELLANGQTASLPRVDPAMIPASPEGRGRGGRAGTGDTEGTGPAGNGNGTPTGRPGHEIRWARPSRTPGSAGAPTLEKAGIDRDETGASAGAGARNGLLSIAVVCGDLRFARSTLLIGHHDTLGLGGTEEIVDGLFGGVLSLASKARLYPDLPGTHRIFANHRRDPGNPWDEPRPPEAAVLGLGAEGGLKPAQLTHGVRLAAIGCSQRLVEACARDGTRAPKSFPLCATLMGSSAAGITPGQSAQFIAQGVRQANERLAEIQWPRVDRLEIIELFLDRAADAWRALQMLSKSQPRYFAMEPWLKQGTGGLRRAADAGYRTTRHDSLSATSGLSLTGESVIQYTIDSRRARTELQAQATQSKLLAGMIGEASGETGRNSRIGRTLFKLLVPFELEPWFGGDGAVVIEVDAGTASIPWELLEADDGGTDPERKPWAVRTKLVRRLRTPNFRQSPADASTEDRALVIGDPDCDRTLYPVLTGARDEARAVAAALRGHLKGVTELITGDGAQGRIGSHDVLHAMLGEDYRVVHIAGHGEPNQPERDGSPGIRKGVVLKGGVFIGATEIRAMRKVPELVFLNCCYLAKYDSEQFARPESYDRAAFAAGVADELIKVGVRNVVAAGWAVDDDAAQAFATAFYESLLGGDAFIDAVQHGREAAFDRNPESNTWAAYQCYGDPAWKWRTDEDAVGKAQAESAVASSIGLAMELNQLATNIRYRGDADHRYAELLRRMRDRYEARWGHEGQVAEAFASVYAALDDADEALKWYARAMAAPDGSASVRASLQSGNLLIAGTRVGDPARAAAGRARLGDCIAGLEALDLISGTAERAELIGRAYLGLALIEATSPTRLARQLAALTRAEAFFERALARHVAEGDPAAQLWPARSLLGVRLRRRLLAGDGAGDETRGGDASLWSLVERLLIERNQQNPDFRSKAAEVGFELMRRVDRGAIGRQGAELGQRFRDLHDRVIDPRKWAHVLDEVEFLLLPWRDLPGQRSDEVEAARGLLQRLCEYAGRVDEPGAATGGGGRADLGAGHGNAGRDRDDAGSRIGPTWATLDPKAVGLQSETARTATKGTAKASARRSSDPSPGSSSKPRPVPVSKRVEKSS